MALGEYVSVSSQRDSEEAQLVRVTRELTASPEKVRCVNWQRFTRSEGVFSCYGKGCGV